VKQALEDAERQQGRHVDVLVANAGVGPCGALPRAEAMPVGMLTGASGQARHTLCTAQRQSVASQTPRAPSLLTHLLSDCSLAYSGATQAVHSCAFKQLLLGLTTGWLCICGA